MRIVTHDSKFHTDDIFAVATLLFLEPNAEVVRSRDPEIHKTADYLVDTGMEYNPALKHFDHHQQEGAGERANGIPYASFGLVWKEYGAKLAGGEKEAAHIDERLVQAIDAIDNGVGIADYKFKNVREYSIGDFFLSFVESRDQEHLNKVFMANVSTAKDVLLREISITKKVVISREKVLALYNTSQDKRLVVLDEELVGFGGVLAETPEAIFVVHPRPDGHWSINGVSDLSKPLFTLRKELPLEWAGKEKEDLQRITGVKDAVFAHRKRFMAAAETKEGAIALAKIALNS